MEEERGNLLEILDLLKISNVKWKTSFLNNSMH